jgi:hypothetical protein
MRYFLISYSFSHDKANGLGNGHIAFGLDAFPNKDQLVERIADRQFFDADEVVILNIYEFRNELDYKAFAGEEL